MNARLAVVETKYGHSISGDPAFPKRPWPSSARCPLCRLPAPGGPGEGEDAVGEDAVAPQWNEDEVARFLRT